MWIPVASCVVQSRELQGADDMRESIGKSLRRELVGDGLVVDRSM